MCLHRLVWDRGVVTEVGVVIGVTEIMLVLTTSHSGPCAEGGPQALLLFPSDAEDLAISGGARGGRGGWRSCLWGVGVGWGAARGLGVRAGFGTCSRRALT